MALKLEESFGIPADYWMGLQLSYERDLEAIQQRNKEEEYASKVEKSLSAAINLPLLYSIKGIPIPLSVPILSHFPFAKTFSVSISIS